MSNDKKWIGMGLAIVAVVVTRGILNSIGGIQSLPYIMQIVIVLLCPISFFMVLKKEKRKINGFQYRIIRIIFVFISIVSSIAIVIIILYNSFRDVWRIYRELFAVISVGIFGIFTLYIVVLTITNIKNIK